MFEINTHPHTHTHIYIYIENTCQSYPLHIRAFSQEGYSIRRLNAIPTRTTDGLFAELCDLRI